MDRVEKFLRKLDPKRRLKALALIDLIACNTLEGLDIRPLKSYPSSFRCRKGEVRALFTRSAGYNVIFEMEFRGNVYKK